MKFSKLMAMLIVVAVFFAGTSVHAAQDLRGSLPTAHDFTLPDQNEELLTLSTFVKEYRGAVVAFYPKNDSRN